MYYCLDGGVHYTLRNLLEQAMATDHKSRIEFMSVAKKQYGSIQLLFIHLAGVFEIVPSSIPKPVDWQGLQDFLSGVEEKLAT